MDRRTAQDAAEKRRYVRLDHIFPVVFRFLKTPSGPSAWHQAFSQDVGDGGLCLTVNHLSSEAAHLLAGADVLLELHISLPSLKEPIAATAHPAWCRRLKEEPFSQYAVGVAYETIDGASLGRIRRYVGTQRFFKRGAFFFAAALAAGLIVAGFTVIRLRLDKETLAQTLAEDRRRQRELAGDQGALVVRMEELKFLLAQSEKKITALEGQLSQARAGQGRAVQGLEEALGFFKRQQEKLQAELVQVHAKKEGLESDAEGHARRAGLQEARMAEKMRDWLGFHQNNRTGLVTSFEGDDDVRDWAFTYDQALAAIVFLKEGRLDAAQRVLDFYLRQAPKMDGGGFANAYYASTGEIVESIAHAGPNIWLALAALHHAQATGDKRYVPLAESIASWLDSIKDKEGGLRGGTALSWYSTEHNLDAYSFYTLLHSVTDNRLYKSRADETLDWLNKNAYSRMENPVVKRGKGDATIATDTYAWSISSIGPRRLKDIGMDPDGIMEFAMANCGVDVDYRRPDGSVAKVRGFDFAKREHLARGGVVSCEWTAQMILAFKIMADYHKSEGNEAKAVSYAALADEYIVEMSKMMIVSLSPVGQGEFCLPYASAEFADTGHGWRTPKGSRTGSVAATAYAVLAVKAFNPLAPAGKLNGSREG